MNKVLIETAIISAIKILSTEFDPIIHDDLRSEIEITLAELDLALKEIRKE